MYGCAPARMGIEWERPCPSRKDRISLPVWGRVGEGLAFYPSKSEVSKRGWREGVGDKQTSKKSPKSSPEMCVPILLRGIGKRVQKRGLNLWSLKGFFAPTPSVRQPLFETVTSDKTPLINVP